MPIKNQGIAELLTMPWGWYLRKDTEVITNNVANIVKNIDMKKRWVIELSEEQGELPIVRQIDKE